jgi:N,N'-diacetyllegionaminate synthase
MPPSSCNAAPSLSREVSNASSVAIGGRLVGTGQPTYVVAEAGVNHDGSLAKALELVDVAVAAGADAVKSQFFRAEELAAPSAQTAAYQRAAGDHSQRDLLSRLELTDTDFRRIQARCRDRSIELLATPFSVLDVDRLRRLGVRAIKIASTDVNNTPLLRQAVALRLPLIVSTGASTADEIEAAVARLRGWNAGQRLILLHCVSCYPVPLAAANLRAIAALRSAYGVPCGFSDHTTSTQAGAWAVAAGACVLEKHFTLDRGGPGPDHAMSLEPAELREYVAAVRGVEEALGSGVLGMTDLEADVRTVARKSVVTTTAGRAGTQLTADMLTIKRPGGGIPPDQLDAVLGRRLAVDAPGDTVLSWDMLA